MKKNKNFYLLLISIFFTTNSMTCYDGPYLTIVKIEIENVDFSEKFPVISSDEIPMKGYMIGVKYVLNEDEPSYYNIDNYIVKTEIICDSVINGNIPAGSDVTDFFRKTTYCPEGMHYSFALRKEIDSGEHSFTIHFTTSEDEVFTVHTLPIILK